MSNETMFYKLCRIIANLEDSITSIEQLGFIVEPETEGTVSNNLYNAASTAYNIAASLLEFPDVGTENDVSNELLTANSNTIKEVSERIWKKYGVKSNI